MQTIGPPPPALGRMPALGTPIRGRDRLELARDLPAAAHPHRPPLPGRHVCPKDVSEKKACC